MTFNHAAMMEFLFPKTFQQVIKAIEKEVRSTGN